MISSEQDFLYGSNHSHTGNPRQYVKVQIKRNIKGYTCKRDDTIPIVSLSLLGFGKGWHTEWSNNSDTKNIVHDNE